MLILASAGTRLGSAAPLTKHRVCHVAGVTPWAFAGLHRQQAQHTGSSTGQALNIAASTLCVLPWLSQSQVVKVTDKTKADVVCCHAVEQEHLRQLHRPHLQHLRTGHAVVCKQPWVAPRCFLSSMGVAAAVPLVQGSLQLQWWQQLASSPATSSTGWSTQPPAAGTVDAAGHDAFHWTKQVMVVFELPYFGIPLGRTERLGRRLCINALGGQPRRQLTYLGYRDYIGLST